MIRLPVIHNETSHATAVRVAGRELVLEPVRVWNDIWCVRRDGRLVPADPADHDAFLLGSYRIVSDGVREWSGLGHWLKDMGLYVPGDGGTLADAERAGHWGLHRVPVEPRRERGSDTGLVKTLARGSAPRAGQQRRAA